MSFFCAEYGIHASLPIYSGGLGALAGDILKEASDRALPLVAVGLLYRQGYFRQRIDASGWQHESWVPTDPERQPMALVTGDDGEPITVTVPVGAERVVAQIWRVDVGRVPLFLLDADRPENGAVARWISSRLYTGTRDLRLAQYLLLGVGGMRALRAMGIDPSVVHLNEGHAAFASLELARAELERGASLEEALAAARARTVFTTHTPVPAGNDTYEPELVVESLGTLADEVGVGLDTIVGLGRTRPDDDGEPFGVTQFALHTSRSGNGVSRRHGEVAREMWAALWPDRAVDEVPIGYVTNGVHLPTWLGDPMRTLLDRHLGEGWMDRAADQAAWDGLYDVDDAELWAARREQRAALVSWARERSMVDRLGRDEPREYVEAPDFDPDVLTIGFARRLATYKRLHVLLQSAEGIVDLLSGERKIQILMAGKAHPRDDDGKRSLQALFAAKGIPEIGRRVAYLDDYDLTHRRAPGHRLRRLGQPPAPAAGGQRHQRDEVRGQRRPAAQRPRRLVGRGLRRQQRLGAVGRRRRRPRRAGRPRRRRAPAPAPRRGRARVLRPRRARPAAGVAGDDARVAAHQRAGVLGDADGARLRRAHLRLRLRGFRRGARAAAARAP